MFKAFVGIAFFLAIGLGLCDLFDVEKQLGKRYCELRHPVEAATSDGPACEQQHILIPGLETRGVYLGAGEDNNIMWINTVERDYLVRSSYRPWERLIDRTIWIVDEGVYWREDDLTWAADENMRQAWKMGLYANGYHFMVYDHHRAEGQLTLFEWDGASHALYLVASVFNFVTKELSYLGYQFESNRSQWIDALLGVFIDCGELMVGIFYGLLGMVIGTIYNPWDTITNIPGLLFMWPAILWGLWNTLADVLSILTLGICSTSGRSFPITYALRRSHAGSRSSQARLLGRGDAGRPGSVRQFPAPPRDALLPRRGAVQRGSVAPIRHQPQ